MINCKYKSAIVDTRNGYTATFCDRHCYPVNDVICSRCSDCEGEMRPPVEHDYPVRNKSELEAIQIVCSQCPSFHDGSQCCQKICNQINPVSVWSQHPNNHCPEKKW